MPTAGNPEADMPRGQQIVTTAGRPEKVKVTVESLTGIATVIAGHAGLGREILSPQMTTPELSLPGPGKGTALCVTHLRPSQVVYLRSLPVVERTRIARALIKQKPSCFLVSGGTNCKELLDMAAVVNIPVLKSKNLPKLQRLLVDRLLPRISLHGVLVRIFDLGTLIIGESVVGKSEAALDLVLRGHKLVADDIVILEKKNKEISGQHTDMSANLLQIRGLGIINIRALYGKSATMGACKVGLVVELEEWKKGRQYSLIGLRERRYRILGVNLPYLKLPVKLGRNMATLIEVAAKNQLLKKRGIFTARDLDRRLKKRLAG
jgi:HPr kinase/phosphorylase